MEVFHYFAKDEFQSKDVLSADMIALKQLSDIRDESLHDHDFVEIVYIHDGKGAHFINGVEYPVQKGNLLYINYGCTHSFKVYEKLVASNLMIKLDYFDKILMKEENIFYLLAMTSFEKIQVQLDKSRPLIFFTGKEREAIEFVFQELGQELSADNIGKNALLDSYINILFTNIFRKILVCDRKSETIIPGQIIDYICRHCGEKLTLKTLSEQCFYNPSYFSRLFKKAYNMTLTDFITEQRMKKFCTLLRETDLSVETIMNECGITNKTGFYNRFKAVYGCTPGEYKSSPKT